MSQLVKSVDMVDIFNAVVIQNQHRIPNNIYRFRSIKLNSAHYFKTFKNLFPLTVLIHSCVLSADDVMSCFVYTAPARCLATCIFPVVFHCGLKALSE